MTTFKDLNLNPKILTALENKGYTIPTPIQLQAIPHLLEGKDILGIAQTGTGKTAAFSLPILHNLANSKASVKSGCVRALILTPTRELASQISENIEAYSKGLNLRHAVIYGGVSEKPQITALQAGVDILIATPGRLMDLMSQGYIRLMQLEIFVLDEADRMLDMGFINDIKKIVARIPEKRQTLFFSATMPATITELSNSILKDPIRIEITPQSTTVEKIDQKIYFVERFDKVKLLKHILKQEEATSVLIFCRTKHGAEDVVEALERSGVQVAAIHGDKTQSAREKALNNFRDGKISVLVATDVAARGIDIPAISHVINYDIPSDPESYVHRIGRTARAGRTGVAISFCDPHDDKLLLAVEKAINYKIPVDDSHPFHKASSGSSASRIGSGKDEDRGHKKPTHSSSKDRESRNSDSDKREVRKPVHKETQHSKAKKKVGFFEFLVSLFKGKKAAAKPRFSKPHAKPNTPSKSRDSRGPRPENRDRDSRSPRPENRDRPQRARPERPARVEGEQKPRPTGATRKISSGKKEE